MGPAAQTPPLANPVADTQLQPGQYVMAKTNAVNAQWQVCKVINSNLIEFPDGSQFETPMVQLGGLVNQTPPMPEPAAAMAVSGLNLGYQSFKQQILALEEIAQANFQLPLEAVLMMARRQALASRLAGSGTMDVINGQALFVPDLATLGAWLETYLLEVQRKEQGGSPE